MDDHFHCRAARQEALRCQCREHRGQRHEGPARAQLTCRRCDTWRTTVAIACPCGQGCYTAQRHGEGHEPHEGQPDRRRYQRKQRRTKSHPPGQPCQSFAVSRQGANAFSRQDVRRGTCCQRQSDTGHAGVPTGRPAKGCGEETLRGQFIQKRTTGQKGCEFDRAIRRCRSAGSGAFELIG